MNNGDLVSGFLYCPDTQQILLQKDSADPASLWALLETPDGNNFKKVAADLLNIKLNSQSILFVYDYAAAGRQYQIFYAEVSKPSKFPAAGNHIFAWFTPFEIHKLPLSRQTRHDLIVGKRVIDSATRKKAGELTIG